MQREEIQDALMDSVEKNFVRVERIDGQKVSGRILSYHMHMNDMGDDDSVEIQPLDGTGFDYAPVHFEVEQIVSVEVIRDPRLLS